MYEKFTDRSRKVMQLANQEATRFNHEYVGTEHILLGLLNEGRGVAANALKNLDMDLDEVRQEVEKLVRVGPDVVVMGRLPQTPNAKKVVEYSIEEARNLDHNYVGTEHLLLGLLRVEDGIAAQVLTNLGLTVDGTRQEVLDLLEPASTFGAMGTFKITGPPVASGPVTVSYAGKKPTLNYVGMLIMSDLLDAGFCVQILPRDGKFQVTAHRAPTMPCNVPDFYKEFYTATETDTNYALMKIEYRAIGKGYHVGELHGSDGFTEEERGKKGKETLTAVNGHHRIAATVEQRPGAAMAAMARALKDIVCGKKEEVTVTAVGPTRVTPPAGVAFVTEYLGTFIEGCCPACGANEGARHADDCAWLLKHYPRGARDHGPCAVCGRSVFAVMPAYLVTGTMSALGEDGSSKPLHDECRDAAERMNAPAQQIAPGVYMAPDVTRELMQMMGVPAAILKGEPRDANYANGLELAQTACTGSAIMGFAIDPATLPDPPAPARVCTCPAADMLGDGWRCRCGAAG